MRFVSAAAGALMLLLLLATAANAQSVNTYPTCNAQPVTVKLVEADLLPATCTNASGPSSGLYYTYGCLTDAIVSLQDCVVKIASTATSNGNFPCFAIDFVGSLTSEAPRRPLCRAVRCPAPCPSCLSVPAPGRRRRHRQGRRHSQQHLGPAEVLRQQHRHLRRAHAAEHDAHHLCPQRQQPVVQLERLLLQVPGK